MTLPASSPLRTPSITARGMQSRLPMRVIALTAVWFIPILLLMSPTFFAPNPELLGLPQDLVLAAGASLWGLVGAAIMWRARSWLVDVLAILIFTAPAIALMILGPAIVLILQNLG